MLPPAPRSTLFPYTSLFRSRMDRMRKSIQTAFEIGDGLIFIEKRSDGQIHRFSKELMDVDKGISNEDPFPITFSFNSPYGELKDGKTKRLNSSHMPISYASFGLKKKI